MQFFVESRGDPDLEDHLIAEDQQVDSTALRILAAWIARRAGFDRQLGATIDRSFVVAQVPA